MIITNVGLAMDELRLNNNVVFGKGTVYSEDGRGMEYCDDFEFAYDRQDRSVITDLDRTIFGDHIFHIAETLIDNVELNFIKK